MEIAYRISDWDTPLRANPNRTAGRYNVAEGPATQYFGLHPLTPWAEYLRTHDLRDAEQLAERRLRIWVAQLDLTEAIRIDFDNAQEYGLEPEDLVADNYGPCQSLAERFRGDLEAPNVIVVPSAALPGTEVVVIFGERVAIPYNWTPIDDGDVAVTAIAERSQPPWGVAAITRYRGEDHQGLTSWRSGIPVGPPGFV